MTDLTALLIMAASGALTVILIIPFLITALLEHRAARIIYMTRMYVFAAEQKFGYGKGAEKLAFVKNALALQGVKINENDEYDSVRAKIEATVRELKYLDRD